MKKYMLIAFGLLAFLQNGCKKAALMPYELSPQITIYKNGISAGRDSVIYSFAVKEETVAFDTIKIPVRIMGNVAAHDRKINYAVIPDSTDAPAANYELLPAIVPANSFESVLWVKVKKTDELKTTERRIWISLQTSEDFQPGVKELQTYLIRLNNYLSKPASWDEIRFGEYSQAKYGLIIRTTGYSDFTNLRPEVRIFIAGTGRNALYNYQLENGEEMTDENGLPVRFP